MRACSVSRTKMKLEYVQKSRYFFSHSGGMEIRAEWWSLQQDLTRFRFNKIAIQGIPQMAVD